MSWTFSTCASPSARGVTSPGCSFAARNLHSVAANAGDLTKRLSVLVYGLTLVFCYSASSLYHGVRLPAAEIAAFARLDGVGIFALIAGSYTPIAACLMWGRWRVWTLAIVWGVAITATVLIASGRHFSSAVGTSLYLGMGWGAVVCYFEIAQVVSHRAMLPIILGGLSYSVGAVLNLLNWPVFYPGVFEAHELFHIFVLLGSLAHYLFILHVVVPYSRVPWKTSGSRDPGAKQSETAARPRAPEPDGHERRSGSRTKPF